MSSSSAARAADEVPRVRGADVFSTYCVLCHGPLGKGDGRAASLQQVPPADLSKSRRSSAYKLQIIREGGAAVNRSRSMPAWREVLSAQEIADVAAYVNTLRVAPASSGAVPVQSRESKP